MLAATNPLKGYTTVGGLVLVWAGAFQMWAGAFQMLAAHSAGWSF